MTKDQATERIGKLRKEIDRYRYLYHVLDKQEISDAALDSLKHELWKLEQQFPELITPDSPTQRVGGKPLDKFKKVSHSAPVLSLEDVFSHDELSEWQERNEKLLRDAIRGYYCELKFDGLSVVLTYEKGLLKLGATRGDGRLGEDVTQNLKTIESVPLRLNMDTFKRAPRVIQVRGEIVMTKREFEALNKKREREGEPLYANPRNVAAGSIRQLDPKVTVERRLTFFVFELWTDMGQKTHADAHEIAQKLGFKTSPYNETVKSLGGVMGYLKKWEKKREQLPYNTDGVVVVVNDIAQERKLGSVGKTDRWMAAYKFAAEQGTTRVKDIIVQVGRTGALTPVAILDTVQLAGTTVSRATLHNEDEIERLDIRVGDTVIVQKAGDIIPDVVEVLKRLRIGTSKKFVFPKKCPQCGSPVARPSGEVAHYCTNKSCFAQELAGLIHFVSRKGFDIEGLGDKIVEQLMTAGLVRDAADFFTLKETDVKPLERFAEKSAENLIAAIQGARNVPLAKYIYALGIRHVGEETARALAARYQSLEALGKASRDSLEAIDDVGPVVAESVRGWFSADRNLKLLQRLLQGGVHAVPPRATAPLGKLKGMTFVITGTLTEPRERIAERIRAAGASVSGSVSARTDYVVAGDDPGSKYDAARKLDVKIISYDELKKLLGGF